MDSHASRAVCCLIYIILSTLLWSVLGDAQFELFTRFLCDNSPVCYAGQPDTSITVTSDIECGLACQRQKTQPQYCVGVNYRHGGRACDLFYRIPGTLSPCLFRRNTNICQFIQRGEIVMRCQEIPVPPITVSGVQSQNCLFPFTSNGQLYYQCAPTGAPCVYGCYLANLAWATCSPDSFDYVAQNKTVAVNVTTPTGFTMMPLRSVNGWLSILSRVDSNFQHNQAYAAYQSGFGDIMTNFWIGLDNLYQMTNPAANGGHQYRLRIEMLASGNSKWYSQEYNYFYLESSISGYMFRTSSSSIGDADDMLNEGGSPTTNQIFATSGMCVDDRGFWWYTDPHWHCCFASFFGSHSNWYSIGDLNIVRMMVKQTN